MSELTKAVFLSYASQDAEAAARICEALRQAGVEVWFDQSELVGGDAWDQSIRKQISECALFIPVLSETTQARREAYFRLEWKLADERTHLMAEGTPFLLPVTIDQTTERGALVPKSFVGVQWTKLPGGETPPAFAARVQKLLGGEAVGGALSPDSNARAAGSGHKAPPTANLQPRARLWLVPAILGAAAIGALVVWQPWRRDPELPPAASKPAIGASLSEAQKLVAQARKIYEDGDELNRDNLFLAEELVQRALALDPAEPTAWELAAWLSYTMVWHLIDESGARRETLLRQANRAVALAPNAVSAQVVLANARMAVLSSAPDNGLSQIGEIERSLQRLAEREPQNWMVQRALGTAYRFMNRTDDAIRALQRALELSGEHPMASGDIVNVLIRRQRFAEAEAILARALARHRSGRLLTFDVVVKCRWRGDTAGALKAIEAWPGWLLQENRGIAVAWQAGYWGRQPVRALRAVQQFPGEYVRDVNFSGPRAVLSARAHELAGNAAAAQSDWRVVAQRCDQDLAANPQDVIALFWKAWALARLGDQGGAQTMATLLRQRLQSVASNFFKTNTVASLWATVGWTDLALAELRAQLETLVDGYSLTRAYLELEPAFDPLRGDPRFQEILAAALAPPMASAPAATVDKFVAVLAFANLSDDKGNEYFSDGISEELLNVLAKIPGLKVSARTSAFYFKGKQVPMAEIARQLGVAYVIEGSVRKQGDKVRITAQLIKAADGFHVWSDTFTRDLKDIFAVQDEIAGLIAQQLQLKLGATKPARAVDPEAHRLVLEGRHYLALRSEANFTRSEEAFRAAVAIAPDLAVAHAGWAELAAQRGRYQQMAGLAATGSQMEEVQRHAARALQLDPSLSEPHAALAVALVDAGRLAEADVAMERGIAANPNYGSQYLWRAHLHAARGRLDTALSDLQHATELDPLAFIHLYIRGAYLGYAGRWTEALPLLDRGASLRSERFLPLEGERALARFVTGRREEAMGLARTILADPELLTLGWWSIGEALWILRQGGAEEEAVRQGEVILAKLAPGNYLRGYVLCGLGRFEEGLPLLRDIPTIARIRFFFVPIFDPARETPAFKRLISEMKVEKEYAVARANLAGLKQEAKQ